MNIFSSKQKKSKIGLLLSGGGARAAYQVGVLRAIAELYPADSKAPFSVISGTSAGSINAVALAGYNGSFCEKVQRIIDVWANFEIHHVFKSDLSCLSGQMLKWMTSSILPFGIGGKQPASLLDNQPLRELLVNRVDFDHIQDSIDSGELDALCVNASSYSSGQSVSFFQANSSVKEWGRAFRCGVRKNITIDTLMASSAIPVIFPAVKLGDEYYGDGSMRQNTPISPVLHLGAEKILMIGVRSKKPNPTKKDAQRPSVSQISGFIMDTLFLNSMDSDMERLERINDLNSAIAEKNRKFRNIEHLIIYPSEDIGEIAEKLFDTLPRTFRLALKFLGIRKDNSSRLSSYLMFNKHFCSQLIELGYADAMRRKLEIENFLEIDTTANS